MPSFDDEMARLWGMLGPAPKMALATCADGRVTARTTSCIVHEGAIWFQTDCKLLKARQMAENPNVALCLDNVQIEGLAAEAGHPLAPANAALARLYDVYFNSAFRRYSPLEDERLYRVAPTLVTLWKYEDGQPVRTFLQPPRQGCRREYYRG